MPRWTMIAVTVLTLAGAIVSWRCLSDSGARGVCCMGVAVHGAAPDVAGAPIVLRLEVVR